ncbi:MAG: polyketide cyclase, partial [Pseudomonadota bacterium]
LTFIFELLSLDLHVRPFEKLVRIAVQDGTERTVKNIKKLIEAEQADFK